MQGYLTSDTLVTSRFAEGEVDNVAQIAALDGWNGYAPQYPDLARLNQEGLSGAGYGEVEIEGIRVYS